MEILHTPPSQSDFIPISEHQSHTPESFFHGPPILHHFSPACSLSISPHDLAIAPALAQLAAGGSTPTASAINSNGHANGYANGGDKEHAGRDQGVDGEGDGDDEEEEEEEEEEDERPDIVIPSIEIWVTSRTFILYSRPQSTGLSIPYNAISLHAIQRQINGLYMQLRQSSTAGAGNNSEDAYDSDATISLTLIFTTAPAPSSSTIANQTPATTSSTPTTNSRTEAEQEQREDELSTLYAALSACANLHPDPPGPGDESDSDPDIALADAEDGGDPAMITHWSGSKDVWEHVDRAGGANGLPPPMPGSGGWITAENADLFFDQEGNWIGRGAGAGAGASASHGGPGGEGDGDGDEQPGSVRRRRDDDVGREEERMEEDDEAVDGHVVDDDDDDPGAGDLASKWRRTG